MRYIFKRAREFIENAPALKEFILGRYGEQIGVETDDEIDAFMRKNVYVLLHPPFTWETDLMARRPTAVTRAFTQPRRQPCLNSGQTTV